MKMKTIFAGAIAALLGMPAVSLAQSVIINGSLVNSYSYGKDPTGSTSGLGWHQTSVGNGAWIDDEGVAHSTGAANIGLLSIDIANVSKTRVDHWSITEGASIKSETQVISDFDWLIRDHVLYSYPSGVYVGGNTYYSFFMHEVNASGNIDSEYGSEEYEVLVRKYTWDVEEGTGKYINVKRQDVGKMKTSQPIDLTYDPFNDVVYGVFYDGSTYKIGTLDMETFKVTNISREGLLYGAPKCIAVNSRGELYAIDASGNVYRIDKTDGRLNTIGNVGFKSQDQYMSATFDLRTDKLYWIGFINNGKSTNATDGTNTTLAPSLGGRDTGVFEIDTNTGAATLIGELYQPIGADLDDDSNLIYHGYRGLQITGIYVDGCFTRKNIDQRIMLKSYPSQMKIGDTKEVTVSVKNIGLQRVLAKNYVVNFYADNELVATIDRDDDVTPVNNLEQGQSQTLTFTVTAKKAGTMTIYAEVVNADDEEQRNNKTEVGTIIVLSDVILPTVELNGQFRNASVKLTWTNPNGHFVEGAEQYAAFSYDGLGAWTMVDGDKAFTQKPNNLFSTVDYPNANTPKAFIVMDPYKAGLGPDVNLNGERFLPHTGNQYFAAFYSAQRDGEGNGYEVDNDDYMVSPILNGNAQTISFWAKGYRGTEASGYQTDMAFKETIEVLYTLDAANLDPKTYSVAKEEFVINDKVWEMYTADLPAGAKHFALHRTSKATEYVDYEGTQQKVAGTGSFMMMIDDITFQAEPRTVVGYNIYKNNEKVETLAADAASYGPVNAENSDLFYVTAIYEDGESLPSNPYGIDYITAIDTPKTSSIKSLTSNYYDLNGRAVKGQLRPGIYVVKQNGQTRKMIIR